MAKQAVVREVGQPTKFPHKQVYVTCSCGTLWEIISISRITNFQCIHCQIQYEITKPMGTD